MKIQTKILSVCIIAFITGPALAQNVPIPKPNPNSTPATTEAGTKSATTPQKPAQRVYQSACPAVLNGTVVAKLLPPISNGQCGERSPLEVTEIAGVTPTSKAVLNCRMATTLAEWMGEAKITAETALKTKLTSIVSSTTYQCRRRNNAPDGKISEHGFANALDIIGFTFEDGKKITLLEDWPLPDQADGEESSEASSEPETSPELEFLKTVRDQACERFTTVLGPESNPLHADHFHFDLGCHGKACTYKICE